MDKPFYIIILPGANTMLGIYDVDTDRFIKSIPTKDYVFLMIDEQNFRFCHLQNATSNPNADRDFVFSLNLLDGAKSDPNIDLGLPPGQFVAFMNQTFIP